MKTESKEFFDDHHMLYYEAQHNAMVSTLALRAMRGLIAFGPRTIHNATHAAVSFVPPLSQNVAFGTLKRYEDVPTDNIRSLDNLSHSIEASLRHPKTTDIERLGAEATLQALDLQRPFIYEMQKERRTSGRVSPHMR